MPEQMTQPGWSEELEAALRDVGRRLAVPTTPDVRAAVHAAVHAELGATAREAPGARRPRRWAVAFAAAAVLLATLALSPTARAVVVRVMTFGGIELHDVRETPTPALTSTPSQPSAERPTAQPPTAKPPTLEQVRAQVPFQLLTPLGRGEPDRVELSGDRRVVTVHYLTNAGAALRIDEFSDNLAPLLGKYVDTREVSFVRLDDKTAMWVRVPHNVAYIDTAGNVQARSLRLSAASLVWRSGGTTVRLEGAATLAEALVIARTMR